MNIEKIVNKSRQLLKEAMFTFWNTKRRQSNQSIDKSRRGGVLGGKQMDGIVDIFRKIAIEMGVPNECIHTKNAYLPGFFRASKNWDFLIITPKGNIIAVMEFKSQVGSYGNNMNNRAEESLGSSLDFWTAIRNQQMSFTSAPWVGYVMVIGRDKTSLSTVRNNEPYYEVLPEFKSATYIDRYEILCRKLVAERHYTATALIWTEGKSSYGNVTEATSFEHLVESFIGNIYGHISEFK